MTFELRYAFKYMFSRRGGLTRLSTVTAMIGIAVGVASLVVVQSIYNGFRAGIEEKVLGQTAHITVMAEDGSIAAGQIVEAAILRNKNVAGIERSLIRSSVVSHEGQTTYGLIKVLLNSERGGVEIGKELARKLAVEKGDELDVLMAGASNNTVAGVLKITGVIDTGLYEYNSSLILVSPQQFETLISSSPLVPNAYFVTLREPFMAEFTSGRIRAALGPGFNVVDWISANRPLFAALSLERQIAGAVFLLMIFVSAVGIASTLMLLANERRFDLAVMKTCGARSRSLGFMFLTEGTTIGLIGVSTGLCLGILVCAVANSTGFVNLSPAVYSISSFELIPDFASAFWISAGAFVLTLVAILLPVVRIARVSPADIFRDL